MSTLAVEAEENPAELEEDACPVTEGSVQGNMPMLRASIPPELLRHWGAGPTSLLMLLTRLG